MKTAKFGGSSLCDGKSFEQVLSIIKSDESIRIVVPSAPGKRHANDTKVTDLLIAFYEGEDVFSEIKSRFDSIISSLKLNLDLSAEYSEIEKRKTEGTTLDYIASRGEYLNGLIAAKALGWKFINPSDVIKFDDTNKLLYKETLQLINEAYNNEPCVIPGFFGANQKGEVVTFSRGGSDITGSLCAAAMKADIYENWTDVSGFFMADPRIVPYAMNIDEVSYKELRELSYMGAGVLHEESIFPVRKMEIPVHIKNTNAPKDKGTLIMPFSKMAPHSRPITGVAGKKGFAVITIEKARMNNEVGFARKVLSVLEGYGISIEHMPTGIDTLSIVVSEELISNKVNDILGSLQDISAADSIDVSHNMALIATVGHGMVKHAGSAAKIFAALSGNNINIRMIDQGSSELNIIVGVEESDYENAVRSIYNAFAI
ncbi:MAG: aspartate kinase [Clostridia bacterium]|nr:aspartate kinase [Clostridia bacterium]